MVPKSLSSSSGIIYDTASGISSVLHALDQLSDVDDLILLQPTSPLRTSSDIDAIVDLRERLGCESAVSLTPCLSICLDVLSRS